MVNHLKILWNGGIDPDTASPVSLRKLASNPAIFDYWAVIAMATAGVGSNSWAWPMVLSAISSLVAGRLSGVLWAFICGITLWSFARLQYNDYQFEFGPVTTGIEALVLAFEATLVLIMLTVAIIFRSGQLSAEERLNSTVNQLEKEVHDRSLAEAEARQSEEA